MLAHRELPPATAVGMDGLHPERPDRVRAIYEHLQAEQLLSGAGVVRLPSREVTRKEAELVMSPSSPRNPTARTSLLHYSNIATNVSQVHTPAHCDSVDNFAQLEPGERIDLPGVRFVFD